MITLLIDDIVQSKLKSVAAANPELADSVEVILSYEYPTPPTKRSVSEGKFLRMIYCNYFSASA